MIEKNYDVVIVGSGAGGGTVASELAPLARAGKRILVLEQGPQLEEREYTGREIEMAGALYEDHGGFLTAQGTLTLAFGRALGGSTVVYTGTSLPPPKSVIERWNIASLSHADLTMRVEKYCAQNHVHLLDEKQINDNNRFFRDGGQRAGFHVEQFPLNLHGCKGSSLCNLGCPNAAKMGTHRVQLPLALEAGVEIVTRAQALRVHRDKTIDISVTEKRPHDKGLPSSWPSGHYRLKTKALVLAGGAVGSSALLLRSGFGMDFPKLGRGFTCHPAVVVVGRHPKAITNFVGHPKSFFIDRAAQERFVLETCMYFPFVTAKSLASFGAAHEAFLGHFDRLQMILVLACDRALDDNRISVDHHGKPVVHYHFTPEVLQALTDGARASAKIFFAAGVECMSAPMADPPMVRREESEDLSHRIDVKNLQLGKASISAAHLMGGCRMGSGAHDSVVDSWGKMHDRAWIRVADSSLFPDALEINPYLTIMALADRVAQKLREEAGALLA